jgi:hypothetical protein
MLYEDAHQHGKEINSSNNDCSAVYDSIASWVVETIHRYHRLPCNLIRFLLNTDTHQRGQVLTAHGAGADFTKRCGLGQGSVLAPLKWKLFLDPLLKKLRTIEAPYTMGIGKNKVKIWATAFADDLAIVGPTHSAYVPRMEFANKYLSHFGVEMNTSKTTYTYASTTRHYESANIWNRHTHQSAPLLSQPLRRHYAIFEDGSARAYALKKVSGRSWPV